jgi:hypothetical protein
LAEVVIGGGCHGRRLGWPESWMGGDFDERRL